MQALSEATRLYLAPPTDDRYKRDRVDLQVTKSIDKTLTHFIADFYNLDDYSPTGRRPPCFATSRWSRQFAEYKIIDKAHDCIRLELPVTDMVVERINAAYPIDSVDSPMFEDFDAEFVYRQVLIQGVQADANAKTVAEFKENGILPKLEFEWSSTYPLVPYQHVGLHNSSLTQGGYALFMEQGTGKTPVTIARICNDAKKHYEKTGRMYRVIIVAPKNVRLNWQSEFKKFATVKGKTQVLHGTKLDRVKQTIEAVLEEDGCMFTAVICSYETLSKSWGALEGIVASLPDDDHWNLAVLDESHYVKNTRTKRFEYAVKLRDISQNRTILTGTPITNTPLDLYSQLEFLGKGYSGFHSYKAFCQFFGRYRLDEMTGREMMIGLQNIPFMQERLARYSYIIRSDEYQKDLPDRVYDVIEVEMTAAQRQHYGQVRDELFLELEAAETGGTPKQLLIQNALTRLLKLAQITSGFISWPQILDEFTGEEITPASIDRIDPDPKLEELVNILKAKGPNDKTIIWSCWVQNIKTIMSRLRIEGIDCVSFYGATKDEDRKLAEERFNCDPSCKVFVGNPAAGGTGLNLIGYPPEGHPIYEQENKTADDWTTNCNHLIYYSQNWSSTARSQSEKRAHRRGTREPVRVTDLVVPNTVDVEIREAVTSKQRMALEISDLKTILSNLMTGDLVND